LTPKNSSDSSTHQGTYYAGDHSHDEFDSFESDNESDEEIHRKTDSGVDMSNNKLPDPPAANGQVYAFMQKIKNIGTLSKTEITKSFIKIAKKRNSSSKSLKSLDEIPGQDQEQKIYESTSNKPNARSKLKSLKIPLKIVKNNFHSEPYENTEFHKPITPTTPKGDSSPKVEQQPADAKAEVRPEVVPRKKSGKSFKSKLRKSLYSDSSLNIGNSFNGTRSTFYLDAGDVDSGIYNGSSDQNSNSNSNANLSASDRELTATPSQLKTPENNRRKSVSPSHRPSIPPPPPPIDKLPSNRQDRLANATAWYHTWGLFKPEEGDNKADKTLCSTSWYTDAGLYVTSGDSVASSSESSGVSTGAGDDHSHSMFSNEPLYQLYNAVKLESISRDIAEIAGQQEKIGSRLNMDVSDRKFPARPSALELIEPNHGPSRTLWCEIPEVIQSEILSE
jgi:neuronal guanine nucleotide exchange factor